MQHYQSLEGIQLHAAWLTIGSFDGIHRGHQAIIHQLTAEAHLRGALAVVLTFYPHPASVLGKRQGPFYLTTPEERAARLGDLGVDVVITHPFNHEVAGTSAQDFMRQISPHLGLRHLLIGHDFALGRGRAGNAVLLAQIGAELGYTVEVVNPFEIDGQIVSSSLIRTALAAGDVAQAACLLGRPYGFRGQVVHGDARGRSLGFPTANLETWSERILPRPGVYVCQAELDGQVWGAVTNVGYRPTFENQPATPRVEAYVLDFNQDLYGRDLTLTFVARLRDEVRFANVQALIDQMQQDVQDGRTILAKG